MNKKKMFWRVVYVVAILLFLFALGSIIKFCLSGRPWEEQTTVTDITETTTPEDTRPVNPINFDELKTINEDIYAWIRIPGTTVDHPILQSYEEHDNFYLTHNFEKKFDKVGSIYTQRKNNLFFSDPNTVIYGHNWANKLMFASLLRYKDPDFFEEYRYMYIYTPDRMLTYDIFAAYVYDDRHILNSFNMYDDEIFKAYLESCLNPKSMVRNIREGVTLDVTDKIETLSTCPTASRSAPNRYLVQGVLIKDEQTQ